MDVHLRVKEWFLSMGYPLDSIPPDWTFKEMCRGTYAMVLEDIMKTVKPKHEVDRMKEQLFVHDMKEITRNEHSARKKTFQEPRAYTLWKEKKRLLEELSLAEGQLKLKESELVSSNQSLKAKAVTRLELEETIKNDQRKARLLKYKSSDLKRDLKQLDTMCGLANVFASNCSGCQGKRPIEIRGRNRPPKEIINECLVKINDICNTKMSSAISGGAGGVSRPNDTLLSANASILSSTKCFDKPEDAPKMLLPLDLETYEDCELLKARLDNCLDSNLSAVSGRDIWTTLNERQEKALLVLEDKASQNEETTVVENKSMAPETMIATMHLEFSNILLASIEYGEKNCRMEEQLVSKFISYFGEPKTDDDYNPLQELYTLQLEQAELTAALQVYREEMELVRLGAGIYEWSIACDDKVTTNIMTREAIIDKYTRDVIEMDRKLMSKKYETERAILKLRHFSAKLSYVHKTMNGTIASLNGFVVPNSAPDKIKIQVNNVTVSSETGFESTNSYEDFVNDLGGLKIGVADRSLIPSAQLVKLRRYFDEKSRDIAQASSLTLDLSFTKELAGESSMETSDDISEAAIASFVDELKYFGRCFPLEKNRKLCLARGRTIWLSDTMAGALRNLSADLQSDCCIFNPLLTPAANFNRFEAQSLWLDCLKNALHNVYTEDEENNDFDLSPIVKESVLRVEAMKTTLTDTKATLKKIARNTETINENIQFWKDGSIKNYIDPNRKVSGRSYQEYEKDYEDILSGRYNCPF